MDLDPAALDRLGRYRLMTAAIVPRPIAWISTMSADGRPNLAPEQWKDNAPPPVRRMFRSSLAWRMCLVAEGEFDAMMTLRPTWEWDVAAGTLIATQAGARVSDRRGLAPRFNGESARLNGLISGAPAVHDGLLHRLRPEGGGPPHPA